MQLGQVDELIAHLHLWIETTLLGHVTEAEEFVAAQCAPVPRNIAPIQPNESKDRPHGSSLARPVGPEESENAAGIDGEAHIVEGLQVSMVFGSVPQFKRHSLALPVDRDAAPGRVGSHAIVAVLGQLIWDLVDFQRDGVRV